MQWLQKPITEPYHRSFSSFLAVPQTWINFDIDILYLRYHRFSPYLAEGNDLSDMYIHHFESPFRMRDLEALQRATNLGFQIKPFEDTHETRYLPMEIEEYLLKFGQVDTLSLVIEHLEDEGDDLHSSSMRDPIDIEETKFAYEFPHWKFRCIWERKLFVPPLLSLLMKWRNSWNGRITASSRLHFQKSLLNRSLQVLVCKSLNSIATSAK